jgi:uncharacterized protein
LARKMLIINILGLNELPIPVSGDLAPQDLDLADEEMSLNGPVHVSLEVQRLGEKVHIRGTVAAQVKLACSRCLADFNLPLNLALDLVALPADGEGRPSHRVTENEEEEDVSVMAYEHEQVNLLPEIRSAVILGVPMKPLCAEDCPGLCLECGERLDASHRPHDEAAPEGPFSRLQKFLPDA